MILIADSGSTKTDWRIIEKEGAVKMFESSGLNPFYLSEEDISQEIANRVAQDMDTGDEMRIFFYGAGCSTPEKNQIVANGLMRVFPRASVAVASDLLGAARALFKDQPGLAVILGTGTNTALYNGKDIVMSIPALGYILGDEGSGAYFGKELIRAHLLDELPHAIQEDFRHIFHLTVEDIKHAVYKEAKPNQFVASFTRFISQHMTDPFIQEMIRKGFRELFEKQIMKVEGWRNQKIRFAGSIAYYFKSALKDIATEYGTAIDAVLKAPIDELVSYHRDILQKNQKS
jgi:glucosamine kinase